MKKLLFVFIAVAVIVSLNLISVAKADQSYPPLYSGVIADDGLEPFVFPEVEDPFSTDTSPFPCWLVNFTTNPCTYPAILLDQTVSQETKDQYVCDILQSINSRYRCVSILYPSVSINPTLPCWLTGYNDGFTDANSDCVIPQILLDPNVSDKEKDKFVCDTIRSFDPTYICPIYLYDANGMLIRDANGNVIIVKPYVNLPKTGSSISIGLGIGFTLIILGLVFIAFPKYNRKDLH